ncbi:hypothetical protein P4050_30525 [Pseudomonas aeruginosa]|nr:hypothetical protein [Pseudomonas aeruginosa]
MDVTTGFYSGLVDLVNPHPKTVGDFVVRRGNRLWDGNPWYPEKAVHLATDGQIKAMNPAHILYLSTPAGLQSQLRTRMDEAS